MKYIDHEKRRRTVPVVAFDDETYWRDPAPFPAKLNATAPELPWGGFIA